MFVEGGKTRRHCGGGGVERRGGYASRPLVAASRSYDAAAAQRTHVTAAQATFTHVTKTYTKYNNRNMEIVESKNKMCLIF